MPPTPKNWSGPAKRDARIKLQTESHIAHTGQITDMELDNCRDLDEFMYNESYNRNDY